MRASKPIHKFCVNLTSSFFVFEIENKELVEMITAANTSGIAGKDITCIRVSPSELRDSAALGKSKPSMSEIGSMMNKNDLSDLSLLSEILINE
jgi:hypothetical protein